ncbi:hypothetical protein M427DRAFT_29644 [Gonapodya prolifera JEL478]|uniref:EF-hand domain-containing protein n=1 Tax=Gonapodya prolifera (strain JEL478) TaxID=1344416 RepID=A0A139APV8_GONPJ|nr:hypothetical protein M427DRAFT_29644 [Gonapodya prolifera JEL478]|eukprot:KXS18758.1 hypothetical protein M427DRAFT_29644 [Gonapodya prolifera JEL478]
MSLRFFYSMRVLLVGGVLLAWLARQRLDNGSTCSISRFNLLPSSNVPGKPPRFYPVCDEGVPDSHGTSPFAKPSDLEDPIAHTGNITRRGKGRKQRPVRAASSAFSITLNCGVAAFNPTLCDKVNKALNGAGNRIAAAIRIVNPITVTVTFTSFCSNLMCNSNVLGQASPASLWSVNNGAYLIPQALLKNTYSAPLPYSDNDITAMFNADFSWWFQGDPPIYADQQDFESVVVHEFLHGMGFLTGWNKWFNVATQDFLTPPYYSWANGTFFSWAPQYIFDSLMIESSSYAPISSYYNAITSFNVASGTTVSNFVDVFRSTGGASYSASRELYGMATSGGQHISILSDISYGGGNSVPLWTDSAYSAGTTLSHFDDELETTPDFLMISFARAGTTLDQKIADNGGYMYGALGPNVVAILDLIGWTINDLGSLVQTKATTTTAKFGTTSSTSTRTFSSTTSQSVTSTAQSTSNLQPYLTSTTATVEWSRTATSQSSATSSLTVLSTEAVANSTMTQTPTTANPSTVLSSAAFTVSSIQPVPTMLPTSFMTSSTSLLSPLKEFIEEFGDINANSEHRGGIYFVGYIDTCANLHDNFHLFHDLDANAELCTDIYSVAGIYINADLVLSFSEHTNHVCDIVTNSQCHVDANNELNAEIIIDYIHANTNTDLFADIFPNANQVRDANEHANHIFHNFPNTNIVRDIDAITDLDDDPNLFTEIVPNADLVGDVHEYADHIYHIVTNSDVASNLNPNADRNDDVHLFSDIVPNRNHVREFHEYLDHFQHIVTDPNVICDFNANTYLNDDPNLFADIDPNADLVSDVHKYSDHVYNIVTNPNVVCNINANTDLDVDSYLDPNANHVCDFHEYANHICHNLPNTNIVRDIDTITDLDDDSYVFSDFDPNRNHIREFHEYANHIRQNSTNQNIVRNINPITDIKDVVNFFSELDSNANHVRDFHEYANHVRHNLTNTHIVLNINANADLNDHLDSKCNYVCKFHEYPDHVHHIVTDSNILFNFNATTDLNDDP